MDKRYKRHELSALWGDADIDWESGRNDYDGRLSAPVVLFESKVLDGWHRYQKFGDECQFEELRGSREGAARFVIAANANRRHLTPKERADAIVRCTTWAKGMDWRKGAPARPTGPADDDMPTMTIKEQANAVGVSERTIKRARQGYDAPARPTGPADKPKAPTRRRARASHDHDDTCQYLDVLEVMAKQNPAQFRFYYGLALYEVDPDAWKAFIEAEAGDAAEVA